MKTKTLPRRDFLQLAEKFNRKDMIAGFYISEKLDGSRAFWDGGISRGMHLSQIPWASVTDPKTGQPKRKIKHIATGLWSRYGNPIMAPDSFLNQLPCCPLDGELWAGRGRFQLCRSICAGDEPDDRFDQIAFAVYSSPSFPAVFGDGEIKNPNFHLKMSKEAVERFVKRRLTNFAGDFRFIEVSSATFEQELCFLREMIESQNDHVYLHRQTKLPADEQAARQAVEEFLAKVLDRGGEGVVIRDPQSSWRPKRHRGLLKHKPFHDAEAQIVGFIAGKEGKQGNVLGKIVALVVEYEGLEFEIGSGLTSDDRLFHHGDACAWAYANPGERLPERFTSSLRFKVGQTITFKYRELSDDGVPKEGRYWRVRGEE